ncbi:DUF4197 domain-containing protein [bacterium]|nr:DUF4197 domain-containing protein [candidate division CSSED10-310 bacterium]
MGTTMLILSIIMIPAVPVSAGGLDDFLGGVFKSVAGGELSEDTIVKGLIEALTAGTDQAVTTVSKENGFFLDSQIRIPLPKEVSQLEQIIRLTGNGPKLDEFILSMNRAAEAAAPQAKTLFLDALKQMTFSDARKILKGRDTEATDFFREKTYQTLYDLFQPKVIETMARVGVTRQYRELSGLVNTLPGAGGILPDIDDYVTRGALDGVFHYVAKEERKIREDPAARTTDLLKKVFGSLDDK